MEETKAKSKNEKREDNEKPQEDNKPAHVNIFQYLKNKIDEEKTQNAVLFENLNTQFEKMKQDNEQELCSVKETAETNFQNLNLCINQINKSIVDITRENLYAKEDILLIKKDIVHLQKQDTDNVELMKTSIRNFFDKIKNNLNLINGNIEKLEEGMNNYKEESEIERKKKNVQILELINMENETLNKKIEESTNLINSNLKDLKEYFQGFKENVENQIKNLETKILENKEETEKRICALEESVQKLMGEIMITMENNIS